MYDDEDSDKHRFYEDVEITWKNYPSFQDIVPNKQSTLIMTFGNYDISKNVFEELKSGLGNNEISTKFYEDKYGNEFLGIYYQKDKIATLFQSYNCIITTLSMSTKKEYLRTYLEDTYFDELDSSVEIQHKNEKFMLRDSDITVKSRTGLIKNNSESEPKSFWKFYQNDKLVSKALIGFNASEMDDCAPTIIMFDVGKRYRRKGLGKKIILGIEYEIHQLGFHNIRLEDTRATPFWRDLGYDIDIDEGEKSLDYLDFES